MTVCQTISACQLLTALAMMITVSSCSRVPASTTDKDTSYAQRDLGETPLGQLARELAVGRQVHESGFLLLDRGHDALACGCSWPTVLSARLMHSTSCGKTTG